MVVLYCVHIDTTLDIPVRNSFITHIQSESKIKRDCIILSIKHFKDQSCLSTEQYGIMSA